MTAARAVGYHVALPRGWVRLRVRDGTDADLRAVVDSVLPDSMARDDAARTRVQIEGRLRGALARAREIEAIDLYLPLHGMRGFAIPASFVVSEALTGHGARGVEAALAELATGPRARIVDVDGSPAVRTDDVDQEADPATGTPVSSRRINYLVPEAGTGRLLAVTCSILAGDDPEADFVRALVALFDAVMTTFRWDYPAPAPA